MEKADNEMYALVDEEFLAKFSNQHLNYMKKLYYSFYAGYCKRIKRKPLTSEDFFKNMHLRRFQLYQLCCPYCGTVSLCIHDKKESKTAGYNFCHSCGRTSTLKNIQKHLARFVRIKRMNRISIQAVAEHRPETEKWLLAYDCYQIEIIELASIIEVLFRDYFEALLFISCESKKDSFLEKIVRKYTGNDFMNIEKTNDIYKKAFGIEIRKNLNAETWDDLLDIVNLRNMIVHNNGQVDKRFESTSTFRRWKDRVDIPLIKIEDEDIAKLLSSVIDAVTIISNVFGNEEIKIGYVDGWLSTSRNMVRVFVALALAVIIMLAPIFSGEYEGVDNIILTSKYGKTKCATAKVIAGIITAVFTTTLVAAFNLLFAFVFYGTEGLDCSILFAPSDYVEAFIPFNITCWTLLKYQILLAFTCTLSVTGITLFLSAISKNQIVALVAAMAIFLFPVLLPITEANPLFRLVGLLPIYHGLAISLLSVEQMSNGMLYAIWAIPAALLFLGVGAGISRRVYVAVCIELDGGCATMLFSEKRSDLHPAAM